MKFYPNKSENFHCGTEDYCLVKTDHLTFIVYYAFQMLFIWLDWLLVLVIHIFRWTSHMITVQFLWLNRNINSLKSVASYVERTSKPRIWKKLNTLIKFSKLKKIATLQLLLNRNPNTTKLKLIPMKTAGKDLLICVKPMKNLFHENVFVRQSMHLTGKEYVCACACVRACVCVCVCVSVWKVLDFRL